MSFDPDKIQDNGLEKQSDSVEPNFVQQELQPSEIDEAQEKPKGENLESLRSHVSDMFGYSPQLDVERMYVNNGTTNERLDNEQTHRYWKLEAILNSSVPKGLRFLKTRAGELFGVPMAEWKKEDFSLYEDLAKRSGIFLEVGGPTPEGYESVDFKKIQQNTGKKVLISNIARDGHLSLLDKDTVIKEDKLKKMDRIDFQADVRQMPLVDGSVGGLFASCLSVRGKNVFQEASRILEPGGIFVYQGCGINDVLECQQYDLELVDYQVHLAHFYSYWGYSSNIILKKLLEDKEKMHNIQ
jgi:SAM-dependent methyltransferase